MIILLKDVRKAQKITLRELAKRSGMTKSTLYNIEIGRHSPTMIEMENIAAALGATISDLYESEYK